MRKSIVKFSMILLVVGIFVSITIAPAYAAPGYTGWGRITQVEVGAWKTYVFFGKGRRVKIPQTLADHDQILNTVLSAMEFGMLVRFYSNNLNGNQTIAIRINVR